LIKAASRNLRSRGWGRWNVGSLTASLDQDVARNALARQSSEVVARVGRTDITDLSNQIETFRAYTAAVFVDLVLPANSWNDSVGDAVAAFEVESDDADTFAKNVVVDLIMGAIDGDG